MLNTAKIQDFMASRNGQYAAYCIIAIMALLIFTKIYQGLSFFKSEKQAVERSLQLKPVEKLPHLSEFHLFGIYQTTVNTKSLPPTTLNLKLEGVFASIPEAESFAIISVPGSEGKLYKLGGDLPGNAKLYRILNNSVIISRDGHLESLSLPDMKLILGTEPHSLDLSH
jgi:type II secretory pathway component PulC